MTYAIKILTLELWALRKRLHDYNILTDELMSEHPAIELTEEKITDINVALEMLK